MVNPISFQTPEIGSRTSPGSGQVLQAAVVDLLHPRLPDEGNAVLILQLYRLNEQLEPIGNDPATSLEHAVPEIHEGGDHVLLEEARSDLFLNNDV
jgi:hypothetical protein